MVRKLLVVLLLVLISPMQAQVLKAWCQDITAVVGKSANITCTFSETVSCKERPFLVLKVPLDSKDFPDDVVDCTNGHCTVSNGYNYREQAGTQQVIEIPSVEKRLEGRYQCQYDTREPQDAKSCTLLVQEANLETGGETQENNVLVTTEGPSGDSEGNGFLVAVMISTVLLVVAILVISLLLWRRQRLKRSQRRRELVFKACAGVSTKNSLTRSQRLTKENNDFVDITASDTPLKPIHACTFTIHGGDGSCVDHCQKHAGTEEEEEEGTESEAVSWLPNTALQIASLRPGYTVGQANEEQHTLLASDTRTANCQEHFRTKEESSVDGFPDNECSIPARPPAYSAGIAKTPLKPQDACAVNIHGKDGSCVDRSRSTGYEQDAEPLASDTPTDNYQDNSPNEEKTSVDRSPDANRPNPTTTPAFSTGIAKTPLKPQDACAVNIHGKDGSCVDRSRSTGCEQDAEPLASDTPTDNYQDNSPNEEKTSVDGLPNAKRQDPATTPAFSTGIAENPQHKVDIATDEDPSRNSACVSSPVAVSPKPE